MCISYISIHVCSYTYLCIHAYIYRHLGACLKYPCVYLLIGALYICVFVCLCTLMITLHQCVALQHVHAAPPNVRLHTMRGAPIFNTTLPLDTGTCAPHPVCGNIVCALCSPTLCLPLSRACCTTCVIYNCKKV